MSPQVVEHVRRPSSSPSTLHSHSFRSMIEGAQSEVGKYDEKEQVNDVVIGVLLVEPDERSPIAKDEEKRLVRKLDRRIMPMLCILYLLSALDRANLGNARLQGLPRDVLHGDPTGALFDWANSAFYFSYVRTLLSPSCPS
ncbi:hypothetical protein BD310DRAFT_588396 [Dichomitus squalens]|uniref:Major facilitator superfamily (MFS) profile domain-containing protein n=1 Tax=Dichomitus squalens TaxID=114155 RepID=A0A4Q9Q8S9_9APHY|nr:hypothetical protein BD310DRAFT_588396 [Dichomitus squalens]